MDEEWDVKSLLSEGPFSSVTEGIRFPGSINGKKDRSELLFCL